MTQTDSNSPSGTDSSGGRLGLSSSALLWLLLTVAINSAGSVLMAPGVCLSLAVHVVEPVVAADVPGHVCELLDLDGIAAVVAAPGHYRVGCWCCCCCRRGPRRHNAIATPPSRRRPRAGSSKPTSGGGAQTGKLAGSAAGLWAPRSRTTPPSRECQRTHYGARFETAHAQDIFQIASFDG